MPKQQLRVKNNIYYSLPLQDTLQDPSKLLFDLGKATKRGIKKCYKCGWYNGTRGLMCKNKQCGIVFKESGEKERLNLDAIKLVSGASRQVFSVRVRGKGPEYRGFVQLPIVEGDKATQEAGIALSEVALCFVDSCQRLFDDSILKCHEAQQNKTASICIHIKSALKSVNVAVPIETKNCLLHTLNFEDDVKQKLWLLSTETRGALVQRISKTVMAVKCQVSPKHPLGYLHFTFCMSKGNKVIYDKFFCSCLNFKGYTSLHDSERTLNNKCVHFYACLWAFASDLQFADEFVEFLNIELQICKPSRSLNNTSSENDSNQEYKNRRLQNATHFDMASKPEQKASKKKNYWSLTKVDIPLHFVDWLTSITERVNHSIATTKGECIKNINCYIPISFFVLLQARIHSSKANSSFYIIQQLTGITYVILNTSYIKKVFDTPQVSLQTMQIIKKPTDVQNEVSYLKVATEKGNDNNFSPFTICWWSNLLPASNFGKLELIFCIGYCDHELQANC